MKKKSLKPLFRHPDLIVSPCEYGHGVFAIRDIPVDTTLEECYHLRVGEEACSGILNDYVYYLDQDEDASEEELKSYSLPLGSGSIYNHADSHNTEYWHDTERDLIIFYTVKDVSAGDQLFINYGSDWWETREIKPENEKD